MIRRLLTVSVAVAAVCCAGTAFAADAATIEKGKAAYDAAKPACNAARSCLAAKLPFDSICPMQPNRLL